MAAWLREIHPRLSLDEYLRGEDLVRRFLPHERERLARGETVINDFYAYVSATKR